ncbi:MAG: hypothetical protein LBF41_01100 [Deltaproteobacteria bacterium]|nr:hypothetical protein [Deltaproteobacteria bacterium]
MALVYHPSRVATVTGIILIPVAFALVSAILGFVYANFLVLSPYFFVIAALLVWSYLTAAICSRVVTITHFRSPAAAAFLAFVGALVGYYCHWAYWTLLENSGTVSPDLYLNGSPIVQNFMDYASHPKKLFHAVAAINETGSWSLKPHGQRTKGLLLLFFWVLEFIIYMRAILILPINAANRPYCERGKDWFAKEDSTNKIFALPSNPNDRISVINRVSGGDFTFFAFAKLGNKSEPGLKLTIYTAPEALTAYGDVELSNVPKNQRGNAKKKTIIKYGSMPSKLGEQLLAKMG